MEQLIDGKMLHAIHRDHALQGNWKDFRDCHIEGDWVLIYQIGEDADDNGTVTFCATDNHSNLFE
jgi:mRNA interferase YafQ